jgi:hypothetical protein
VWLADSRDLELRRILVVEWLLAVGNSYCCWGVFFFRKITLLSTRYYGEFKKEKLREVKRIKNISTQTSNPKYPNPLIVAHKTRLGLGLGIQGVYW